MPLHFTQSCPRCGRRVEVPVRMLGYAVACRHCRAEFMAGAAEIAGELEDSGDNLLARVEAVLKQTEPQPTMPQPTMR